MAKRIIEADDIIASIADALQFVSYYHPEDFVLALKRAWTVETHAPARHALLQILINSKLSTSNHRPVCQDTGVVHVFVRAGMDVCIIQSGRAVTPSFQTLANRAVAQAYRYAGNPLRASMVRDPLGSRTNTQDNSPAVVHIEWVEGDTLSLTVAAKGGGGDVKARYAMLNPSDSVADWIISQIPTMGAGWCPPGVLGVGVGGSPEQAMLMAKQSLFSPIDIHQLQEQGAQDAAQALRLDLFNRINALGIGAQGLGGDTTVLDVKVKHAPSHAAMLPVAIIPNCAATRFISFELDGNGPATLSPPNPDIWSGIPQALPAQHGRQVNLDTLTRQQVAQWRTGETLLLSGKLLTARDAAHKRMAESLRLGSPLPINLHNRSMYYVGPVDPIPGEAVGPAGPTTSTRMDKFLPQLLEETGLLVTIGKAERSQPAIEALRHAGAAYLIAVGGAAYLISQTVKSARIVAYEDLGMEAIYEFTVHDMPVVVAIDTQGSTLHKVIPIQVQA